MNLDEVPTPTLLPDDPLQGEPAAAVSCWEVAEPCVQNKTNHGLR